MRCIKFGRKTVTENWPINRFNEVDIQSARITWEVNPPGHISRLKNTVMIRLSNFNGFWRHRIHNLFIGFDKWPFASCFRNSFKSTNDNSKNRALYRANNGLEIQNPQKPNFCNGIRMPPINHNINLQRPEVHYGGRTPCTTRRQWLQS